MTQQLQDRHVPGNARRGRALRVALFAGIGMAGLIHADTSRSTNGGPALEINACKFLGAEELATTLNARVTPGERNDSGEVGPSDYITAPGYSSTCLWRLDTRGPAPANPSLSLGGASYVILNVLQWKSGSGDARRFLKSFRDAAMDGTIDRKPVALKLGDESLWWGDGVAVSKGDRSFGISVHLVGGRVRERLIEEALAAKIAPRL